MKYWLSVLFYILVGVTSLFAVTDTIAPPPDFPNFITGPIESCVGDTSVFTIDMPVSCSGIWYVDGVMQTSSSNELQCIWLISGTFIVELEIVCDTTTFSGGTMEVLVGDIPYEPTQIIGDDEICSGTTSIYTTEVAENESCMWKIDGIIQISDSATMTYYWSELGDHQVEVAAINDCGISDPAYLNTHVFNFPIVNLGSDTSIFIGQSLLLDAGNPGSNYLWSTGDTTQTIIVSESGNYEVTVSNSCGHVADDIYIDVIVSINDYVNEQSNVVFINDKLYIENKDVECIFIYNSTGLLLLKSSLDQENVIFEKGIFIIVLISNDGNIYRKKIFKP